MIQVVNVYDLTPSILHANHVPSFAVDQSHTATVWVYRVGSCITQWSHLAMAITDSPLLVCLTSSSWSFCQTISSFASRVFSSASSDSPLPYHPNLTPLPFHCSLLMILRRTMNLGLCRCLFAILLLVNRRGTSRPKMFSSLFWFNLFHQNHLSSSAGTPLPDLKPFAGSHPTFFPLTWSSYSHQVSLS